MSLKDFAEKLNKGNQIPFMENKEKGDTLELINKIVTINEYGFLKDDDNEEYAVFTVKEIENEFFFAGAVLTEHLQKIEAEGLHEEITAEGLPAKFTQRKSKNKRTYTSVEFYADEN